MSNQPGFWGRLSLRWQVAIAILAPCAVLPIFSSFYFPSKLNSEAEKALERRAESLGVVAGSSLGPTVGLMEFGLAKPEELDNILHGFEKLRDVPYAAVFREDGRTSIRFVGNVPAGPFPMPQG